MSRLGVRSGLAAIAVVGVVANLLAGCASALPPSSSPAVSTASPELPAPIRIGVILPRSGDAGALAAEELYGIQIAVDVLNADGGVDGAPVSLEIHQIDSATQAPPVLDALKVEGVNLVMGAYSSELSIPLSAMVSGRGMVYWETGAVADMLTGRGLPNVFRVGASSTTLGTDSGAFVLGSLAPLLGRTVPDLRVALVNARDDYATEVAQAADRVLSTGGADIVARISYPPAAPVFGGVLARLAAVKPDVIVLASHIPDGIAFRQQMIAAGLHVGALVGTTMAECVPDFATPLGPDVVGIFGSDRPSGAFNASALAPDARALYDQFASRFAAMQPAPSPTPAQPDGASDWSDEHADAGWDEDGVGESALEEGVSGFSAAWALIHDVLPAAAVRGPLTAETIADAARAVDLPAGSLPNGSGLAFSTDPMTLGQNERAIGLVQQWQAPDQYAAVWPATFATAPIKFVPLPR